MSNKARSYILTINNCKMTDEELQQYIVDNFKNLKYVVFQREKGEKKGTEHIQMYIEFNNPVSFNSIKKSFPNAHIESRKGSREQARVYCMKEDTRISGPYEIGTWIPTQQGKRTDIDVCLDLLENGESLDYLRENYTKTYFRYMDKFKRFYEELKFNEYKNKWRDLEVTYISGKTGIGKTRAVMEHFGYNNVYRITNYDKPWEQYQGQEIIIFEEFRNSLKIEDMLNYLDGYPLMLPARYSDKVACFNKVFIISNWTFQEQYNNIKMYYPSTYDAFYRRIHAIFNVYDNVSYFNLLKYFKDREQLINEVLEGKELKGIYKIVL